MAMRAPSSELPIVLEDVRYGVPGVTILDRHLADASCPARRPC